jgi:hypothetical protein
VKYKNIEFIATSQDAFLAFDPPAPTKKLIPEWYKNQGKYTSGVFEIGDNGNPNHTIKACMPVFDMLSAGYTITMPADAYFKKNENGNFSAYWSTELLHLIESHPISQYNEYNIPDNKYQTAFKMIQPWIVKTPPGYSCLFINPTYRTGSPISIFPAIVDTDKHPVSINFPFLIDNDFEGLIEYGTPIVQVIPFKREDWKSSSSYDENQINKKIFEQAKKKLSNRYKTFYRTVKKWD